MQDNPVDICNNVSLFEEDVALQEATLETITGQLQAIEEAIQRERSTYEQNRDHLNHLRERETKLQHSIRDNTDLVRAVETALRKTLESLKQKLVEATANSNHAKRQKLLSDGKVEKQSYCTEEEIDVNLIEFSANETAMAQISREKTCDIDTDCPFNASWKHGMDEESTNDNNDFNILFENLHSTEVQQVTHSLDEELKTVDILNSCMENRCWSGSLFAEKIHKNPNLLLKILYIQSQELSAQVSLSGQHLHVRRRFVLGTCLDPISLLFEWQSPRKRYLLPWESKNPEIDSGENTANRQQEEYQNYIDNQTIYQQENNRQKNKVAAHEDLSGSPSLDPNAIFCPYDLTGTCIDTSCPYQHLPSTSTASDRNLALNETHQKMQQTPITDEARFSPLPSLRLWSSVIKVDYTKEDNTTIGRSRHSFNHQGAQSGNKENDSFLKHKSFVSEKESGNRLHEEFVPLPIILEENIANDSSASTSESEVETPNYCNGSTVDNGTHSLGMSIMPWWWSGVSKASTKDNEYTNPSVCAMSTSIFPFLLDDVIQIWMSELCEFNEQLPLSSLNPSNQDEKTIANKSTLTLLKYLAGSVDLFRLCSSSGRKEEASKILSAFSHLTENEIYKKSSLYPLLTTCLAYIHRIALSPSRSTACDIFSMQQSLFLISEWLFAVYASHQKQFIISDESFIHWRSFLDKIEQNENIDGNRGAALPFSAIQLETNCMIEDFFSLLPLEESHVTWIELLCRFKELGEKCAKLVSTLGDPYLIPSFLEFLWSCIDDRGHYTLALKQRRRVFVMLLIFPSIFLSVAALATENMRIENSLPSQRDHRIYASFVSVEYLIQAVLKRVLLLSKLKNDYSERQMFDGLLLAPFVAISVGLAVELEFHAKAQRRIEHVFQQTLHGQGPSAVSGVIFSSLLWSQLAMLRCCFSALPLSVNSTDDSAIILVKLLKDCGVSPSHVSLMGDTSLTRSSGDFAADLKALIQNSPSQKRDRTTDLSNAASFNISLQSPSFVSLDGILPSSILMFGDRLRSLHARQCHVQYIPETIGVHLNLLEVLDLSHNELRDLPNSLCSIVTLKRLDISYNSLGTLPADIGNLNLLEVLDASYNRFKSLPLSIINCSKLQVIDIRGENEIPEIPRDLSLRLKDLHTLTY